jgi:hypothetical protein
MSMQPVSLAELQSVEGGFNWRAAIFVGGCAALESGGNPVVAVVAGAVAGLVL